MMKRLKCLAICMGFCATLLAQNPNIHNQFGADPTARVFNDTLYLYCSHDIPAPDDYERKDWFCMHDYHVFSTTDLVRWQDHGPQFSQDDVSWVKQRSYSMWAPDCIYANGQYYLYFPAVAREAEKDEVFGVGIAVSKRPEGPFRPTQQRIEGIKGIDPGVFIDDDGQAYIYWAEKGIHGARLKTSMTALDSEDQLLLPNTEGAYKEGPFMLKRDGTYYLTYALQDGPAEALAYATSDSPLGPFEYKGKIMDIIPPIEGVSDPKLPYCWTNHHSIVQFRGQWYLFYHHNDYSPRDDKLRSVRIDSLTFLANGSIQKVVPTFRGVGVTDAASEIQIDRYSHLQGSGSSIAFVNPRQPFDGWYVRLSQEGDAVRYNKVCFSTSPRQLLIRYRSRKESNIKMIIGSQTISFQLPAQEEWITHSLTVHQTLSGIQDLSLQLVKGDIDIDWIRFEGAYRFDKPLYGAAYYSEYTPTDRLDEDIRLMKEAGLTVVRVGESTWSLFEPQDGQFEFAWMDQILDKMHEAGIKVILGTPTYSIPSWLARQYPEVLSHTIDDKQSYYGIRQNMDLLNPVYRRYSERIIRKMVEHFAGHPAIIGYQVDNEVESRKIDNQDYFEGFREYIRQEFKDDLKELNRRWGLNYWGMNINSWDDFYDRKGVTNPSYKLWWERWNRKVVADFLNWQADIVKEYRRPEQFITHCFMPSFSNMDQVEAFRQMEYPAINVYFSVQDYQEGLTIAYTGDFMRPLCMNHNYLVTETNAQTTGWDSRSQMPPYDGQLRQNMYAFLASGANMVEYWHWASIHYGQETYWRGILGHEGLPNRIYREFARGAAELDRIGSQLVNLKKKNRVALLYSHDSKHALDFMPYTDGDNYKDWWYYQALYKQNIECDILCIDKPEMQDFSQYDMLVIPPLYVASDELLRRIDAFVKAGGEIVMCHKSGYCNPDNAVRTDLMPGILTAACGFTYQEYSSIGTLNLKVNKLGAHDNTVNTWMELLQPTTAKTLASVDHPFFGQWPCITENSYGKGHLIYIGTVPSDDVLYSLISRAAERKGILAAERKYRFPIILRSGINSQGRQVHYIFNFSPQEQTINYPYQESKSLLDDQRLKRDKPIRIEPWGVIIGVE